VQLEVSKDAKTRIKQINIEQHKKYITDAKQNFICESHAQGSVIYGNHPIKTKKKNKLHGFGPRVKYTNRLSDLRLLAKLVLTFADRGCRMVSTMDSQGR
jgi:hypothetical protein